MAPEARREAILDAAQKLFMERGWDAVTVSDVLEAAGLSKGGFYHHFTAKEDLLTGLVTRMTEQILSAALSEKHDPSDSALQRFNAFMASSVRWKSENVAEVRSIFDVLAKPGNDILFRRVFEETERAVVPVLTELIANGVADGSFDTTNDRITAEVIVNLAHGRRHVLDDAVALAASGKIDAATGRLGDRIRAEEAICDRLLGLPDGSVVLSPPDEYRRMLVALATPAT